MNTNFLRALCLSLLLAISQLGALTHGISHLSETHQQDQKTHHSPACEQCAAYAQLGGAVGSTGLKLPALAQTHLLQTSVAHFMGVALIHAYSARAPPRFA